ncbi:rod shape-determining protein RodA [Algiphilus sp. W345]|uniref:Peptidoglycan glycosyltransferase MrdB n=1 Tax=Banduia mediterranea TaxID=3075609 RepID=A0ABU2WJN6_9GAMM|nr:rod shape-determining protein RodA [Algiphilus sp. W345]MDT0497454.1 rod shape-determining protein RodA [Algiphilus sp. W345]
MTELDAAPRSQIGLLARLHVDAWLAVLLLAVCSVGLFVIYSATGSDGGAVISQVQRIGMGIVALLICAQAPPELYRNFAPYLYAAGLLLLLAVLVLGDHSKGAQRWLDLGVVRFQPSEIMKIAVPMMVASYLHGSNIPPRLQTLAGAVVLVAVPTALVAVQPDLGTSLLVVAAGGFVLFFGGLSWRWIASVVGLATAAAPIVWMNMREYQQQRVLTFLDPSSDPLGAGYHITQSKIAIGSGGIFGKGWLNGTQASLDFLPESHTDFIFAVFAEEMGLLGVLALLTLYTLIVARGLVIALRGQDTFQRILAGGLSLTFFLYVFINIGMVMGLMPVVGVPLPLVSFGGTSMVSLMAGFGILMSIQTHRKLISS